jgi:hypothetical protein
MDGFLLKRTRKVLYETLVILTDMIVLFKKVLHFVCLASFVFIRNSPKIKPAYSDEIAPQERSWRIEMPK